MTKAIAAAESRLPAADLGQSIANDIMQSTQAIVASLDLGSPHGLAQSILRKIDAQSIAYQVLDQTSEIAETVLAQVADGPATLLANVIDLPGILG